MVTPNGNGQTFTEKARAVEQRGDVILQVTQTAWDGYFRYQQFFDHLATTGTRYPTIVVMPDNYAYDGGTLQLLLRNDKAYQDPGMLILKLTKNPDSSVHVELLAYLK